MINYSTSLRTNIRTGEKKVYATAQAREVLDFDQFVTFVAEHQSKYDAGDIVAVLTTVGKRLRELLLAGNKVNLGLFGNFWISLGSVGARAKTDDQGNTITAFEAFTVNNIKKVKVLFTPGKLLDDMYHDATFMEVPVRRYQRALMDVIDQGKTIVDLDPTDDIESPEAG